MFNQKKVSSNNRESLDETFLGRDASFKGELSFGGTLCIDGMFEGQINTSGTLIISKTGEIKANIEVGAKLDGKCDMSHKKE